MIDYPACWAATPASVRPDLAVQLGVSVPTLHRLLQEQAAHIVSAGKARRTRYALRRPCAATCTTCRCTRSATRGRIEPIGTLSALHPQGSCLHLTLPARGGGGAIPPWPLPRRGSRRLVGRPALPALRHAPPRLYGTPVRPSRTPPVGRARCAQRMVVTTTSSTCCASAATTSAAT